MPKVDAMRRREVDDDHLIKLGALVEKVDRHDFHRQVVSFDQPPRNELRLSSALPVGSVPFQIVRAGVAGRVRERVKRLIVDPLGRPDTLGDLVP